MVSGPVPAPPGSTPQGPAPAVPRRPNHFTVLSDGKNVGPCGQVVTAHRAQSRPAGPGGLGRPLPTHPLHSVLQPLPCSLFFPLKTQSACVHGRHLGSGRDGHSPRRQHTARRAFHACPTGLGLCLLLPLQRPEGAAARGSSTLSPVVKGSPARDPRGLPVASRCHVVPTPTSRQCPAGPGLQATLSKCFSFSFSQSVFKRKGRESACRSTSHGRGPVSLPIGVLLPCFVDFGPLCFLGIDTYINREI